MPGRWRATGCGIPRYHQHSTLHGICVHAVHPHIDTIAEIAKVLLQCSLSGFTRLKAIRLPGRLAHRTPAFEAVPVVCHDLNHIDHSHTLSLYSAMLRKSFRSFLAP